MWRLGAIALSALEPPNRLPAPVLCLCTHQIAFPAWKLSFCLPGNVLIAPRIPADPPSPVPTPHQAHSSSVLSVVGITRGTRTAALLPSWVSPSESHDLGGKHTDSGIKRSGV